MPPEACAVKPVRQIPADGRRAAVLASCVTQARSGRMDQRIIELYDSFTHDIRFTCMSPYSGTIGRPCSKPTKMKCMHSKEGMDLESDRSLT